MGMALILADHESGFEIARQWPVAVTATPILLVVIVLVVARKRQSS
jgi:hypothetical protein